MYKNKYFKYKKKYIDLQNQIGGADDYELDLEKDSLNQIFQNEQKDRIALNSKYPFVDITANYMDILHGHLDKTMELINNELNLDFINRISAIPYKSDLFNIKKARNGNYSFENDELNYKISRTKILSDGGAGGGGGYALIFLERNDEKILGLNDLGYPENLVLKLFEDNNFTNYSPMVIAEIKDKLENVPPNDERYVSIDKENFMKYYNLDPQYNTPYIDSTRGNSLYLGVPLSDFKNEMVQNIILNRIFKNIPEDDPKVELKDNLIKYYNFLHINIIHEGSIYNTTYSYKGILMEQIDFTLYQALESDKELPQNIDFQKEFTKYINSIAYLKNNNNRFTHTDLKTQNVFMTSNLKCFIADLDKSSVTYKGIRFYNNKLTSKFVDYSKINKSMEQITKSDDNLSINIPVSALRQFLSFLETEQVMMRYSLFPFIPYFDFYILYGEIKFLLDDTMRKFLDDSPIHELLNNFHKDVSTNLSNITQITKVGTIDHSNYGDIIWNIIIMNPKQIPLMTSFEQVSLGKESRIKLLTESTLKGTSRTKIAITDILIIKKQYNLVLGGIASAGSYELLATPYIKFKDIPMNEIPSNDIITIVYTGNLYLGKPNIGDIVYKTNRFTNIRLPKTKVLMEYMKADNIIEYLPSEGGAAAAEPKIAVTRTETAESTGSNYQDAESGDDL